ncbi:MAG TPA: CDC27 family protein [Flavobacterium sp.]|jgi:tetratricopeptide (TPR) repeat protein
MKIRKYFIALSFAAIALQAGSLWAQGEPEDIAAVTDDFQDSFYESLKQKGIENYDKAVTALEKCLQMQPQNAVVYFELGKNYLLQKDYKKAYESFEKASTLDPKNMWYLVGMYDVCYETRDYAQAIVVVNKLIDFKKEYKEDLTSLYMNTQQFDKALELINELNDKVGKSDLRENYKLQILKDAKYQGSEKANLLDQIKKNPKEESNYISLIYLYSESNQEEKAMEIAKKLEEEIPSSDWAQVSLFKFSLNNGDGEKAVKSMNAVFASRKIDNKIKHRILNEFLIFAKDKPQFDADLEKAISYFTSDRDIQVAKEIGKFYHSKNKWDKAIKYYEMHLKSSAEDMETIMLLLQAYSEQGQFDALAKKSESLIETFPMQPHFYYFAGLANNQLKNFKKAKDQLEAGMDYLVDDLSLETNFNIQLGEAYNGLGDMQKKETYFKKAESLLKKQKKQ